MTGTLLVALQHEPLRLLTGLLLRHKLARELACRLTSRRLHLHLHLHLLRRPCPQPELRELQEPHHHFHRFHHPCLSPINF